MINKPKRARALWVATEKNPAWDKGHWVESEEITDSNWEHYVVVHDDYGYWDFYWEVIEE